MKFILSILIFFICANISFAQDAKFHPAQTEAEKILNKVLMFNENKKHDVYLYVLRPPFVEFKEDEALKPLFTKEFIAQSSKEEYELIKKSCGGTMSVDKRPCDSYRDINPIICASDVLGTYLYKTIKTNETETFIQYVWPNSNPLTGPVYKLVKEQNNWKLDKTCIDINDINLLD